MHVFSFKVSSDQSDLEGHGLRTYNVDLKLLMDEEEYNNMMRLLNKGKMKMEGEE